MCISLCRVDAPMAEDMLDGRYRHTPVYQDRCARHPSAVEADVLSDMQLPDYALPTTPPTISGSWFRYNTGGKVYVPDNSVETYKAASGWSTYASKIYPMSEYTG